MKKWKRDDNLVMRMTEQIFAVQKMQDYIEAHLTEKITPAALADICSFSPWYARRLRQFPTGLAFTSKIMLFTTCCVFPIFLLIYCIVT